MRKSKSRKAASRSASGWVEPVEPRLMLATILGYQYGDANENGVRDAGETRVFGTSIFIDVNGNGTFDGNEPRTFPNSVGEYSLLNVPVGTHNVRLTNLPEYRTSEPAGNTWLHVVTVTADDQTISNVNFGLVRIPGTITGYVVHDRDGDAYRDPTDLPLAGWTVFLDTDRDFALDAGERFALTAADGSYRFDNVPVGSYRVTERVPEGWHVYNSLLIAGPLPYVGVTVSSGGTYDVNFLNFPAPRSALLDPAFGVSGVIDDLYPDAAGAAEDDDLIHAVEDAPGDGFFVLSGDGLFKLRDDGSPDPGFGTNGHVALSARWDRLAVDSAGRPFLARANSAGPVVTRFTTAGAVDRAYGIDGEAQKQVGSGFAVGDLEITPSGKAVVVGTRLGTTQVVQFDRFGHIDGTFSNGSGLVSLGSSESRPRVAIGPGERIVIIAHRSTLNRGVVYRLNPTGTRDNSLDGDGEVLVDDRELVKDIVEFLDVRVRGGDGAIFLAARRSGQSGFHVLRLTQAGKLDYFFGGGDAVASVTFPDAGDSAKAAPATAMRIGLIDEGRVVVVGKVPLYLKDAAPAAARFLSDGTPDPSYGDAGRVLAPLTWHGENVSSAYIGPDGHVIAALGPPKTEDGLVRLLPAPPPDNVSGIVFDDTDEDGAYRDGAYGDGEPGVGGVTVFLDADDDGQRDESEPAATTNARGGYTLPLAPGEHRLRVVVPDGFAATDPAAGAARPLSISAGQQVRGANFGLADVVAPVVTGASVSFPSGSYGRGFEFRIAFSEYVGRSLSGSDFRMRNLVSGSTGSIAEAALTYDPDTHTVRILHLPPGDGVYRLSILTADVTDPSGNRLAGVAEQHLAHVIYSQGGYADTFEIARTPAGDAQVLKNANRPMLLRADLLDALLIDGDGGADIYTLDLANGDPLAAADAVRIEGGAGTQVLRVKGSAGRDVVRFSDVAVTIDDDDDGGDETPTAIDLFAIPTRQFDGRGGGDALAVTRSSLLLDGPQRLQSLDVGDAAHVSLVPGGTNTLVTHDLFIANSGRLHLEDNDLVLHATPDTRGERLASVVSHVRRFAQTTRGLSATPAPLTGLAAMINPGLATLGGEAVDENAILVKYTYNGDANLDGRVNADDYFRIRASSPSRRTRSTARETSTTTAA